MREFLLKRGGRTKEWKCRAAYHNKTRKEWKENVHLAERKAWGGEKGR